MGPVPWFALAAFGFLITGPCLKGVEATSCRKGWMSYGKYCYGFFPTKMSWYDAEIDCQSQVTHGHLASIRSKGVEVMLAKYIKARQQDCQNVWIGLQDDNRMGQWKWSNGSPTFYRFQGGQPIRSRKNEYCAVLPCDKGYLEWGSQHCDTNNSYICQN
ncbi:C-type lectin-like [Sphaerodactylus townsendi]|uniref:C-type lectin-like n=1 Tax=Sphaerodactylus townsendi TaxID=933632 RepID=UPI0020267433|nr:C-type lectin-like [Sphaerodactylus townsendi]